MEACYLHGSELKWKVFSSQRSAPRWINGVWYNRRPVHCWEVSLMRRTNSASLWKKHPRWLFSAKSVLSLFSSDLHFFSMLMTVCSDECAVMTVWENTSVDQVLHTCLECSSSTRESFTYLRTYAFLPEDFSLAGWICSQVETKQETKPQTVRTISAASKGKIRKSFCGGRVCELCIKIMSNYMAYIRTIFENKLMFNLTFKTQTYIFVSWIIPASKCLNVGEPPLA